VIIDDVCQRTGTPDDPMPAVPDCYVGYWLILRHSGRKDSGWRGVGASKHEEFARRKYRARLDGVRQGGLRLVSPDGVIAAEYWAPRVRTRW
jgi:hypothetical protein